MADVDRSARDGHSTAGTLGIGLGAIARQASWLDVHSVPGQGTVLAAQVWPAEAPAPAWAAGSTRPMTGEDGLRRRLRRARRRRPAPGAGLRRARPRPAGRAPPPHGRCARSAPPRPDRRPRWSSTCTGRCRTPAAPRSRSPSSTPTPAWSGTPASATSPARSSTATAAGAAWCRCPASPATSGRRSASSTTRSPPARVLVMHSDGVVDRWNVDDYPGLLDRSPLVIAATVLRDAGVRRDDACVLVARAVTDDRTAAAARACCASSRTSSWSGSAAARWPPRSAWNARTRSGWPPRSARSAGSLLSRPGSDRRRPAPTCRFGVDGADTAGRVSLAAGARPGRAAPPQRRPAGRRRWTVDDGPTTVRSCGCPDGSRSARRR